MTLEQWAYIGEIGAAVAVIASLVYLGIQLRNGNREARAAIFQSAIESELFNSATFAEHAGTWDKLITGKSLDEGEEARKGILLFNMLMTDAENRYQQFSTGYLDFAAWASRRNSLERLVHLPIFAIWRQSIGAMNHASDFLAVLDDLYDNSQES